jgi:hypothetical protein
VLGNGIKEWTASEPSGLPDETQCWILIVSGDFQYSCGHMDAALTKFLVMN